MQSTAPERFDIVRYAELWGKVSLSGIEFESVGDIKVPPQAIGSLRYMMDIEDHTVSYLRDLLNTKTVLDPETSRFLVLWAAEESFHGEALGLFLAYSGDVTPGEEAPYLNDPLPRRRNRTKLFRAKVGQRRWRRLLIAAASYFFPNFTAVHMTWGAINELTTLTGYKLLAAKAEHPVLSELLRRIIMQERLHFSFYYWKAKEELIKGGRWLQLLNRLVLKRFFAPVGVGAKSWEEFYEMADYLLEGEEGRAELANIDMTISGLPGLSKFHPLQRAMNSRRHRQYVRRKAA